MAAQMGLAQQNTDMTSRTCYVCGTAPNPIVASEPSEHRFDKPVMPEGVYRIARCRDCSTLYVDSDVTDEYLATMYEGETAEWVNEVVDRSAMVNRRRGEFEAHWVDIKAVRAPAKGDRLLDVGCQTGEFGSITQRDGVIPNGVELSRDYAVSTRKIWGPDSTVHPGPLGTAPFAKGSFQYVSALETLEHVCDPIAEVRVLRKLIADDGILVVSVPSTNYFHLKYWALRDSPAASLLTKVMSRRNSFYATQVLPHTHIYNFSDVSLRRMLKRGGFDVIESKPTGWPNELLNRASAIADKLLARRLTMAPSVLAIARPTL